MTFLKKQSFGFYASLVVCVLAIISVALYSANASGGYYNDSNSLVVFLTVMGIVLVALSLVLAQIADKSYALEKLCDLVRVAIPCFIIAACLVFLSARVYSYGIIFFSDLEAGNAAAMEAATQSVTAVVFYVITAVLSAVTAFFAIKKAD